MPGQRERAALEALWDDPESPLGLINAICAVPRRPLHELSAPDTDGPGLYLCFTRPTGPPPEMEALYSPELRSGQLPVYAGSSRRCLAERLKKHRISLQEAEGVCPRKTWVTIVPTRTARRALGLEAVALDVLRPPWNSVSGFGSNAPGTVRRQGHRLSLWDALHPGRRGSEPTQIERSAAWAAMLAHRCEPLSPTPVWPELPRATA